MTSPFLMENGFVLKEWTQEIIEWRLSRKDYELLLMKLHWEFAAAPFLISGYKLFHIYFSNDPDERSEPPAADSVLKVYFDMLIDLRNNSSDMLGIVSEDSLECRAALEVLSLILKGGKYDERIVEAFCNLNPGSGLIAPEDILRWAILRGHILDKELQDILGVFQNSPHVKLKPAMMKDLEILATGQALWFLYPNTSQQRMIRHIKGNYFFYSKNKMLPNLLQVDPRPETIRAKGHNSKEQLCMTSESYDPIPIPSVVKIENNQKRVDLEKAIIVCELILKTLLKEGVVIPENQIMKHPLIKLYSDGLHPLLKARIENRLINSLRNI